MPIFTGPFFNQKYNESQQRMGRMIVALFYGT
jgi:hypothetical protein